jgi:prepilin signal peptidase PulO-like enzyme (type II secretory pathway)
MCVPSAGSSDPALAVGGGNLKTVLPFGPFMVIGALVAIFAAQPITAAYSHLTGR